jgi:hypothetical protein
MNFKNYLLGIFLLIFISSCGGGLKYYVKVDSFGDSDLYNKSYVLLPVSDGIDGLEFNEYSAYVHRALKKKGFSRSLNGIDEAKIVIFMDYGISDPKTYQESYSIPQWGQTGVSSSYTSGSIGSYGSYSGTTSYTPSYGVTGYTSGTSSYTEYTRYLKLSAVDVIKWKSPNKSELTELWKTSVISTGSSGDLRKVMPILVVASEKYLGKDTGQQVEVTIEPEGPHKDDVKEIKGIKTLKKESNSVKKSFFGIF